MLRYTNIRISGVYNGRSDSKYHQQSAHAIIPKPGGLQLCYKPSHCTGSSSQICPRPKPDENGAPCELNVSRHSSNLNARFIVKRLSSSENVELVVFMHRDLQNTTSSVFRKIIFLDNKVFAFLSSLPPL